MKNTKFNYFKRSLFACIFLSAPLAHADEWAGSYVGGSVGYGHAQGKTESVGTPGPGSVYGGGEYASPAMAESLTHSYSNNKNSAAVSARIGYNWQKAKLVYGVEAGLQVAPSSDVNTLQTTTLIPNAPGVSLPIDLRQKSSIEQMATLRGRMGLVKGDWLFYGSAGIAVARVKSQINYNGEFVNSVGLDPLSQGSESSNTRVGFILGAGFDYALSKNWSLRTEYSYFDLGKSTQTYKVTPTGPAVGPFFADATARATTKWAGSQLMVGLNYRF